MPKLVRVHSELLTINYLAPCISFANFWRITKNVLVVITSLSIAFISQGFWRKTNTYLEQPVMEFTDQCIFLLGDKSDPNNLNNNQFWSTMEELNAQNLNNLLTPFIQSEHIDRNGDGKTDEIVVDVELHFSPDCCNGTFKTHTVFYALAFSVDLKYRVRFQTRIPIFGYIERLYPGESISTWGNLQINQKQPFTSQSEIFNTNGGAFDVGNLDYSKDDMLRFDSAQYFLSEVQTTNLKRNFSLQLTEKMEIWAPLLDSSDVFKAKFRFMVREQLLTYRCGIFELLKWAWIQYLSILIVVRYAFESISAFLYENQILPSIVYNNVKSKIN